jgi:hypothetical protein
VSEHAQPEMSAWGYLRLILLGIVIGIPAALLACVFLAFVHDLEHWLWHDLPHRLDVSSPRQASRSPPSARSPSARCSALRGR